MRKYGPQSLETTDHIPFYSSNTKSHSGYDKLELVALGAVIGRFLMLMMTKVAVELRPVVR